MTEQRGIVERCDAAGNGAGEICQWRTTCPVEESTRSVRLWLFFGDRRMRRSAAIRGVRMFQLRDILGRNEASELHQLQATEFLGPSERDVPPLMQRFEAADESGVMQRCLGDASGKRVPIGRAGETGSLYRTRDSGFTARHSRENLVRDHAFNGRCVGSKSFL